MNQVGSCVAVYPLSSSDSVLEVIKQIQAFDNFDQRLSVISTKLAEEKNSTDIGRRSMPLHDNRQNDFWLDLGRLLKGEAFIQASESNQLKVIGALSSSKKTDNSHVKQWNRFSELHSLLYLVGVPQSSFEHYENFLKTGKLLLIAHGDYQLIECASNLLDMSSSVDVALHFINTD